jgi:hypothetical protein
MNEPLLKDLIEDPRFKQLLNTETASARKIE